MIAVEAFPQFCGATRRQARVAITRARGARASHDWQGAPHLGRLVAMKRIRGSGQDLDDIARLSEEDADEG